MKPLTLDAFEKWLDAYGKASNKNDAKASSELFAQDARYYESPFDEPMLRREAIYQYRSEGAQTLKDKGSKYENFSVKDIPGIARWQSEIHYHQIR